MQDDGLQDKTKATTVYLLHNKRLSVIVLMEKLFLLRWETVIGSKPPCKSSFCNRLWRS